MVVDGGTTKTGETLVEHLKSHFGQSVTHPEDHPNPSGIDRDEWNKLSKQRKDNRPLLAVIVGRRTLHVELVTNSGDGLIMSSIE